MPGKPSDKTFKEIVELVQNHENPKPSAIVQRFKLALDSGNRVSQLLHM